MGTTTGWALRTDHYELTMLDAALADGTADRPVTFEVFFRHLPDGLAAAVMAGARRVAEAVESVHFGPEDIEFLARAEVVGPSARAWLRDHRFRGDLTILPDGTSFGPDVPIVAVDGTFGESVLLETIVLSIINADVTVASHAAAIRSAAGDATLIEMGSRRTHEDHAVDAATAAYLGGFDATSNLEAGRRHGVPTAGTAAHAWTLVHTGPDGEAEAFATQLDVLGPDTVLLVDTFDIAQGIRTAVRVANDKGFAGPGAVRIDSGDLLAESRRARALLDELGAHRTRVVASGDLDRAQIAELRAAGAPVDGYGVGTNLVAAPPLGFVYKLVAAGDRDGHMLPVEKTSEGKATAGGRKTVVRIGGRAVVGRGEDCRVPVLRAGRRTDAHLPDLQEARATVRDTMQEAPA